MCIHTKSLPSLFASFFVRQFMCAFLSANTMNRQNRIFCCCHCDALLMLLLFSSATIALLHIFMYPRDIYSVYQIPKTIYFAATVRCRRYFFHFFCCCCHIVVDVNSEYSLSLLCMDILLLSFDYRIRQNKYKSKSF